MNTKSISYFSVWSFVSSETISMFVLIFSESFRLKSSVLAIFCKFILPLFFSILIARSEEPRFPEIGAMIFVSSLLLLVLEGPGAVPKRFLLDGTNI